MTFSFLRVLFSNEHENDIVSFYAMCVCMCGDNAKSLMAQNVRTTLTP
jgi:hypothetical protein